MLLPLPLAVILLFVVNAYSAQVVKLASFNVQIFGLAKSKQKGVMRILAEILCRFDGVFIQEIREKRGKAFNSLIEAANSICGTTNKTRYEGIAGPRHGTTKIKEQIGLIYRPQMIKFGGISEVNEFASRFERSPDCFAITLRKNNLKVSVLAVHLDPQRVVTEMEALYDAAPKCKQHAKTENLLILGDMNADCGYLSRIKRNKLRLRKDSSYKWLIPDGVDTTVGGSSCTYDRIIASGSPLLKEIFRAGAFDFEKSFGLGRKTAQEVSDHFPVEVEIKQSI